MKYSIILTLTLMMLLPTVSLGTVNYIVPMTTTAPVIDGDLTTGWAGALSLNMAYPEIVTSPKEGTLGYNAPVDAADLSVDIYIQWDDDNLYVAARVYDDSLNFRQTAPGPFNGQDVFQLAFNLLNNPAASFLGSAPIYDLAAQDSNGDGPFLFKHEGSLYALPNAEIGAQVLADGYTVELKAPWSDFGYTVHKGDVHGIGFLVVDYEAGSGSTDTIMFDYGQNVLTNLGVVTAWNTMTLVGENDCGLWGFPAGDFNEDCRVDFDDFAYLAARWLDCTDPDIAGCVNMR